MFQLTLSSFSVYLHLSFLFIVLLFVFESLFFLDPFKTQFLLTAVTHSRLAQQSDADMWAPAKIKSLLVEMSWNGTAWQASKSLIGTNHPLHTRTQVVHRVAPAGEDAAGVHPSWDGGGREIAYCFSLWWAFFLLHTAFVWLCGSRTPTLRPADRSSVIKQDSAFVLFTALLCEFPTTDRFLLVCCFFCFLRGGSAISPRYSSDAPAVTLDSAALIGAVGHMTVIGRDMSGLAIVIGFKIQDNLKGNSGGTKTTVFCLTLSMCIS